MDRLPRSQVFHGHCLSHKFFLATALFVMCISMYFNKGERQSPAETAKLPEFFLISMSVQIVNREKTILAPIPCKVCMKPRAIKYCQW